MNAQIKDVVVNYTYFLKEGKSLSKHQKLLFKYSFLKCEEYGFKVNVHCNQAFREVLEELDLEPYYIFNLYENEEIDSKVFWAYHKIKVYNSRPIREWHLDIDAVFKNYPTPDYNCDIIAAYIDTPLNSLNLLSTPANYEFPPYCKGDIEGLNMSAVMFLNDDLKDMYCSNAFKFMNNNKVLQDNGWEHMVWIEQSSLKQICDYYDYAYNFLVKTNDYYHLGSAKKYLNQKEIKEQIKKLKDKIWQQQLTHHLV